MRMILAALTVALGIGGNVADGRDDAAMDPHAYDEAIRLHPKDARAYLDRGDAWSSKGDQDRAIADFDEAIRLEPRSESAFLMRAKSWGLKVKHDRAISDYTEALRIEPKRSETYFER